MSEPQIESESIQVNPYTLFVQGATLHSGGGVTLEPNGRYLQICIGQDKAAQTSLGPDDALKISSVLVAYAERCRKKSSRQALSNQGDKT